VTKVVLNGESRGLPGDATVATAVREAGVPAEGHGVAVAVDGEVVPRARWSEVELHEGQEVEVVHAVQGG
jgi:sulfur carrier protein